MLTQLIASFSDNFKQKTRNPFFGTLILIWIVKNWELVYALFYFDNSLDLDGRINYIKNYYSGVNFYWNLLACIGFAFISLIVSYLLLSFARLLVNYYDDIAVPQLKNLTDSSSIVLKSTFQNLEKEKDELKKKLINEKERRIKAEIEVDELEKKIFQFQNPPNEIKNKRSLSLEEKIVKEINDKGFSTEFHAFITYYNKRGYVNINEVKSTDLIEIITGNGLIRISSDYSKTIFSDLGERVKEEFLKTK